MHTVYVIGNDKLEKANSEIPCVLDAGCVLQPGVEMLFHHSCFYQCILSFLCCKLSTLVHQWKKKKEKENVSLFLFKLYTISRVSADVMFFFTGDPGDPLQVGRSAHNLDKAQCLWELKHNSDKSGYFSVFGKDYQYTYRDFKLVIILQGQATL